MTVSRFACVGALPVLVFAAALVVGATLLATGTMTMQPNPPLTLSEAAALHDEAEITRLIALGADPNVPAHVRRGIIRKREFTAPPLEAAIGARRVDSLRLLVSKGALVHEGNLPRLSCLARATDNKDVIAFFEMWRPGAAAVDCSQVTVPW